MFTDNCSTLFVEDMRAAGLLAPPSLFEGCCEVVIVQSQGYVHTHGEHLRSPNIALPLFALDSNIQPSYSDLQLAMSINPTVTAHLCDSHLLEAICCKKVATEVLELGRG